MWHTINISPWLWSRFSCFKLQKHIIHWQNTISCVGHMMMNQNCALQMGPVVYSDNYCFNLICAVVVIYSFVFCTVLPCCWTSGSLTLYRISQSVILALLILMTKTLQSSETSGTTQLTHRVISQKMWLISSTTVRMSNLTVMCLQNSNTIWKVRSWSVGVHGQDLCQLSSCK
jgi:hypothetical protein